jgi:hypothetical protein
MGKGTVVVALAAAVAFTFGLAGAAGAAKPPFEEFGAARVLTPKNPVVRAGTGHEFVAQVKLADYIPADFDETQYGGIERDFVNGVPIGTLDGNISVQYFLKSPVNCFGGVPRVQLAIDADNDGDFDKNAFGYLGAPPSFNACTQDAWTSQDLTADAADNQGVWDLSQLGGGMTMSWDQAETYLAGADVLSASVVIDATWAGFAGGDGKGRAFFDNVRLGDATFRK